MIGTVRSFINLILKHRGTKSQIRMRLKSLTDDEKSILLELVRLAGFIPDKLVTGEVAGAIIGGEEYLINDVCPFKVVDKGSKTLYDATGFLNCAIWSVGDPEVYYRECAEEFEELVSYLELVVRDSIPFEPIKLSQEKDDCLICSATYGSPSLKSPSFVKRPKDDDKMSNFIVGAHMGCGVIYRAPEEISCAKCGLKVSVPDDVVTYGDLRKHLLPVTE